MEIKKAQNWKTDLDPEKTAKELHAIGFTPEMYQNGVQADRKRRLETFKKSKVKVLIEMEESLIEFGEKVMDIMREEKKRGK